MFARRGGCIFFPGVGGRRNVELYFFGLPFQEQLLTPKRGVNVGEVGVYPMRSSDNSIVGFREPIRLREMVNSLILRPCLLFPSYRLASRYRGVGSCFISLRSSLFLGPHFAYLREMCRDVGLGVT